MGSDDNDRTGSFANDTSLHSAYLAGESRNEIEFHLTRILALSSRRWGAYVESRMLATTGETRPRWQTLFVLSVATPPVTTSLLSNRLAIQWPPLIRTLNSLEADGLIRRTPNPHDKRSRYIEITPAGLEVVERVQPALAELRAAVLKGLSEDDMRHAARVLQIILAGVADADTDRVLQDREAGTSRE